MNAGEHEQVHRDLGVYVLGALEPAERDHVERHLAECDTCRDELASLAAMPSLLARATAAVESGPELPPLKPVIERVIRERRTSRRRNRLFAGIATAAALALAVVVAAPMLTAPAAQRYVADAGRVTASVEERDWGMAVRISTEGLARREGYVALAVAKDGHRTQVASWTATQGAATVEGACYLAPGDMSRLEIVAAPGDEVVAVLRPASS